MKPNMLLAWATMASPLDHIIGCRRASRRESMDVQFHKGEFHKMAQGQLKVNFYGNFLLVLKLDLSSLYYIVDTVRIFSIEENNSNSNSPNNWKIFLRFYSENWLSVYLISIQHFGLLISKPQFGFVWSLNSLFCQHDQFAIISSTTKNRFVLYWLCLFGFITNVRANSFFKWG